MKILTSSQIREVDSYTIKHEPINSIELMERASKGFIKVFTNLIDTPAKIKVFCGPGNNGGDGLAIARILISLGYEIEVFQVKVSQKTSPDFAINFERLNRWIQIQTITQASDLPDFLPGDILIDAIFGSGLSRPAEGLFAEVIHKMNSSGNSIFAVDIASGLFSDKPVSDQIIVKPKFTISFQIPKLAFFCSQNAPYVGKWFLADIGLHPEGLLQQETANFYTELPDIRKIIKKRDVFSHKGSFGSAMLIAGSYGKMGAALLGGKACLRSGVGLLTIHVPECGYQIIQTTIPEAMTSVDISLRCFSEVPDISKFSVIGLGPGLGTNQKTIDAMREMLQRIETPVVIDADGINILAKQREMLKMLPSGSIITPHPKEFERVAGKFSNDFEKFELQKSFSKQYNLVVVLKGAFTSISDTKGNLFFNSTGNPGMATGGSGDMLTGIITGLVAQKYNPVEAAIIGVFLHGLAGDIAAENYGEESLLPGDMIEMMGKAFISINS